MIEMVNDNEFFGEVRWCMDDLRAAFEAAGIEPTEANVEKLFHMCESHNFTDQMIERGWEVIDSLIEDGEWESGE